MGSAGRDDDPADGWFPESIAAGYDEPGRANSADVVVPSRSWPSWPTVAPGSNSPSGPVG
jgi:hypothetical protein